MTRPSAWAQRRAIGTPRRTEGGRPGVDVHTATDPVADRPRRWTRRSADDDPDVHNRGWFSTDSAPLSTIERSKWTRRAWPRNVRAMSRSRSVGVDQLPDGGDLTPELVVDGDLARDLVAGVQDRRVIPAAKLGTDPEERDIRLFTHQEHRDLARHDDRLVSLLAGEDVHRDAVVLRHDLRDALGR